MDKEQSRSSIERLSSTLPSVDRRTLDERVYEQLRDAIMSGKFKPGDVVTLRGLAAAFGTSLMPVRGAVSRLAVEHALNALPNRSITLPKLTVEEFDEMTEIRVSLESLATRLATSRLTTAQIVDLERLNHRMGSATPADYFKFNREFHFAIYEAAARPVLFRLINGAWLRVGPLLNSLESQQTSLPTVKHDWTIAALRRGDAEDAAASIAADIRSAAHTLRELISANAEVAQLSRIPKGRRRTQSVNGYTASS